MSRYFKVVTLGDTMYLMEEIENGRVHFGWGWHDLRRLKKLSKLTNDEKVVWRYSKFMLERLGIGDRLVVQFERPLRKFLIVEVTGNYDYNDPPKNDFNHFRHCKQLTPLIDIDSSIVTRALRHDLSKRGHYYQIYNEESVDKLNEIIASKAWTLPAYKEKRSFNIDWRETKEAILPLIGETVRAKWQAKHFEEFVAQLIKDIPGVEIKKVGDSGKGWDLLISLRDPLSGEVLHDDVPVQCKNHRGLVTTEEPIDNLKRCIENSGNKIAYLFILGDLADDFIYKIGQLEQKLTTQLGKEISLVVVDQEQIIKLYLQYC